MPVAVGLDPRSVIVDLTGRFVYVVNRGSDDVSAFLIHSRDGSLEEVPGSPFKVGARPFGMHLHANGKFAYVANSRTNDISGFAIDSDRGALRPLPGSPFRAGSNPVWPVFHPSGRFLYINDYKSNSISGYAIDPATGVLSGVPGSPFHTGTPWFPKTYPREPMIDPSGRFLYAVNRPADSVSGYEIDCQTGALAPIAGSPFRSSPRLMSWRLRLFSRKKSSSID
jgi:6-phosphogluconolactonase (cycloisomerase 2 family)